MAIAIKNIPILNKKESKLFNKIAEESLTKKGTITFRKEIKIANKILKKAKL